MSSSSALVDTRFEIYAGFWMRAMSSVIDSLMVVALTTPLLFAVYGEEAYQVTEGQLIRGPAEFFISWVLPSIAVILFWVYKSATPGKMLFGLEVVDAKTGEPIHSPKAVVRYIAYFASILPCFLGIFWIGWDPKKQGFHDKIAGTLGAVDVSVTLAATS